MAVRIKNRNCEWRIGDDGMTLGFFDLRTNTNYAQTAPPAPCAYAKRDGWKTEACAAAFDGALLRITFAGNSGSVTTKVDIADDYFVFTVQEVTGDFDEVAFVNIPTTLQACPEQPFGAGMIALSLKSNVEELPGPQQHLWTAAYRQFGFAGAQTGLVTAPFAEMRAAMKTMVGNAPGVPHSPHCGPWALDSDLPPKSNVFGSPSEENVDRWIDFCHQMGFNAIEFNGAIDYGSYQPNPTVYPRGYDSVKAVIDKLHAAGILAGLHTMSFSISKRCDWVTPKPDPRLAKEKTYTLSKDLSAEDVDIFLEETTADLPPMINYYIRRSMTLQIEDELIQYTAIKTDQPYAVLSCTRGILGTKAVAHPKGAKVHHLKECWSCFVPDGESTLFTEVAQRIATAVNTCGFDFVYLDGLDGAHVIDTEETRWHYGAKFTFEVFKYLERPIMMEMATFHHHLWYVRSRMQAWDHATRAHKRFTDLHVFSNDAARRLFMPLHLGWVGLLPWINPSNDPTHWDDVEYMWSKALATDANYTLQRITPDSLLDGAWLKDLAPTVKTYERLRQSHYFPAAVKQKLAVAGDEFRLQQAADGEWEFLPIQAVRHQVDDLEGLTDAWEFQNKFHAQPMGVRIQALPAVDRYESEQAIVLADFAAANEFTDFGPTITILNSGKLYTYPSAAPGMTASVVPAQPEGPAQAACGKWSATRAITDELIPSSAPDDRFSLLDHFEREYRLHPASWVGLGKTFAPGLDLSNNQGLGLWIKGDGQGQLANIVLVTRSHGVVNTQHYIKIDFTGWRYVELLVPETIRFDEHSWPFERCHYGIYRSAPMFSNCIGVKLWFNDVPVDKTVSCLLSPIKALPLIDQPIVNPSLTVAGKTVVFPVELVTGQYLEYWGGKTAKVFSGKGDLLAEVAPQGDIPTLATGANNVRFACEKASLRPHAWVTVFTKDNNTLRR